MKRTILALAAAAAVASSAAPAAAQRTGANQAGDREALRTWARCLINRHTRQVNDLLAADFRSDEDDRLMRRLSQSSLCPMLGVLRSSGVLLTGELAEQLLERRRGQRPLAELTALMPERPPIEARVPSEALALCTVREAPQAVAALFATDPGTEAERAAMRALQPQVGQCLPAGERAAFNTAGLRAILALGAYRLARHNQPEAWR